MTPDQFERLQQQLAALEPETKNIGESSARFVRDQLERVQQYGVNVRVSPKQQAWLDDLYGKHVGSLDGLGADEQATREEVLGEDVNDMDDEIPF